MYWTEGRGLCFFLPKLIDPPVLGSIFLVLLLPHGVPTSCLSVLVCPFWASSKFGRILPVLPLSILLTAYTSLLTLPPTTVTIPSSSLEYSLSIIRHLVFFYFFNDVVGNVSNVSCLFLPKLVDPPVLGSICLVLLPSHMVNPPPSYLFLFVHLGPLLNLEGSFLFSLFLSFSLPLLAFSLFLPPLPLFSLPHWNTLSLSSDILSSSTFSMMWWVMLAM